MKTKEKKKRANQPVLKPPERKAKKTAPKGGLDPAQNSNPRKVKSDASEIQAIPNTAVEVVSGWFWWTQ